MKGEDLFNTPSLVVSHLFYLLSTIYVTEICLCYFSSYKL